jgi:hypothetical protein
MNVGDGEFEQLAASEERRRADEFAAKRDAVGLRDADRHRFKAASARQQRQHDDVTNFETPDLFGELDIIDALLAAHFLDVLNFDSFVHGMSNQRRER